MIDCAGAPDSPLADRQIAFTARLHPKFSSSSLLTEMWEPALGHRGYKFEKYAKYSYRSGSSR